MIFISGKPIRWRCRSEVLQASSRNEPAQMAAESTARVINHRATARSAGT